MKFDSEQFVENIESRYVTEYGAEVGEVFCKIIYRDKNESVFNNFKKIIKNSTFFDLEKVNFNDLRTIELDFAKKAIISSIIKECKYSEYFMNWNEGNEFALLFLNEFEIIEEIYTNSSWDFFDDNLYKDELEMIG